MECTPFAVSSYSALAAAECWCTGAVTDLCQPQVVAAVLCRLPKQAGLMCHYFCNLRSLRCIVVQRGACCRTLQNETVCYLYLLALPRRRPSQEPSRRVVKTVCQRLSPEWIPLHIPALASRPAEVQHEVVDNGYYVAART
jgi:hypothetical protein